ncbi:MAG: hypothetical protein WC100_01720 [Sterolibacterium sp.]
MNLSTAIFLINDNVRAVLATYEAGDSAKRVMFKTFDHTIKKDDIIVVPTSDTHRHGMTTCKVVEVDVEVDFSSHIQIDWVIGKVELANAQNIKEQEEAALTAIRSAEKNKKKNELRAALEANIGVPVKSLSIAAIGVVDVPAVEVTDEIPKAS